MILTSWTKRHWFVVGFVCQLVAPASEWWEGREPGSWCLSQGRWASLPTAPLVYSQQTTCPHPWCNCGRRVIRRPDSQPPSPPTNQEEAGSTSGSPEESRALCTTVWLHSPSECSRSLHCRRLQSVQGQNQPPSPSSRC